MDLLPTDEQDEICAQIRAVLNDRIAIDGPVSDETWRACAELGWFRLGVAEERGGVGYGVVEEVLMFEQLGAAGAPGAFLGTVLASHLEPDHGHPAGAAALEAILDGEARVAMATPADDGRWLVQDHGSAAHVLAFADGTVSLHAPEHLHDPVEVPSIDELIPVCRATLTGEPLVSSASAPLRRRAAILSAAYLAGIAAATADQSVAYAKDRQQFGQPVGAFQAVKHRCADMATRAEAARAQTRFAALVMNDERADTDFQVHAARVVAAEAAITNAQTNIQNHGGIGFTWEHTAHRYLTRSRVWSVAGGDRTHHLKAVLGATAPL